MFEDLKRIADSTSVIRIILTNHETEEGTLIKQATFEGFIKDARPIQDMLKDKDNLEEVWVPLVDYWFNNGEYQINHKTTTYVKAKQRLERFIKGLIPRELLCEKWAKMADDVFTEFSITALRREGVELTTEDGEDGDFWSVINVTTDCLDDKGDPIMTKLIKFKTLTKNGPVEEASDFPFLCLDFCAKFPYGMMKIESGNPEGAVYRDFDGALTYLDSFCMARTSSKSRRI